MACKVALSDCVPRNEVRKTVSQIGQSCQYVGPDPKSGPFRFEDPAAGVFSLCRSGVEHIASGKAEREAGEAVTQIIVDSFPRLALISNVRLVCCHIIILYCGTLAELPGALLYPNNLQATGNRTNASVSQLFH